MHGATTTEGVVRTVPEEVAASFGVEPAVGLASERAAELLVKDGPNALPEEPPSRRGDGSSVNTARTCRSSSRWLRSCHW